MSHRKKAVVLLLGIFVTIVLFLFFQALFMPKYMESMKEGALIAEYDKDSLNHEVVFIGDCEVYENFSPVTLWENYGITSFIRGSASQTIWQSYYLLKDTLRKEKPEVVVFNVLSMQYDQAVSEAYNRMTLDGMEWSEVKAEAVKASMTEEESMITYLLPFFRYHSRWSELTKEDFRYLFRKNIISYNGYLMQTGVKPAEVVPEGRPMADYRFSDRCYEYLDGIRQLCREEGITLILIKAPSLYPYWYPQWDSQIQEYAQKYGLAYYNMLEYTEEAGIDYRTDTYDAGLHLNVSGAEKLSVWFGKELTEHYGLTDYRTDPEYARYYDEMKQRYDREKEEQSE